MMPNRQMMFGRGCGPGGRRRFARFGAAKGGVDKKQQGLQKALRSCAGRTRSLGFYAGPQGRAVSPKGGF